MEVDLAAAGVAVEELPSKLELRPAVGRDGRPRVPGALVVHSVDPSLSAYLIPGEYVLKINEVLVRKETNDWDKAATTESFSHAIEALTATEGPLRLLVGPDVFAQQAAAAAATAAAAAAAAPVFVQVVMSAPWLPPPVIAQPWTQPDYVQYDPNAHVMPDGWWGAPLPTATAMPVAPVAAAMPTTAMAVPMATEAPPVQPVPVAMPMATADAPPMHATPATEPAPVEATDVGIELPAVPAQPAYGDNYAPNV